MSNPNIRKYKAPIDSSELFITHDFFEKHALEKADAPLVSICIPLYNGEKYLKSALDSVIEQTYTNIEIVIVDDRSTDNGLEIAESYKERNKNIFVYKNEQNQGLVGNWEQCITVAKGDWIKFLFQDDLMDKRCVEKMITACIKFNTKFSLCARQFIFDENSNKKTVDVFTKKLSKPENIFNKKSYYTPTETSTLISTFLIENVLGEPICTMFHKSLHQSIGGFNQGLKQMVDYDYNLKIVLNNPFVFLQEKLVSFRVHNDSTTSKNSISSNSNTTKNKQAIRSTVGDFILLLEQYRNNNLFDAIQNYWSDYLLTLHQKYIYLRACKYMGVKEIDFVLKDILENIDVLKDYRYNLLKYKIVKFKYNKYIKPLLNKANIEQVK